MKINRKIISDNFIRDERNRVQWQKSIGKKCSILYDNMTYDFVINNYDKKSHTVFLKYNDIEYKIASSDLLNCGIGSIVGKYLLNHKYSVGEIVNANEILECIRDKNGRKAYKIRCIYDNYIRVVLEINLNRGHKCAVCNNKVIVKGINDIATTNPALAELLLDKNDSFKYSEFSHKILKWKCPNCGNIIMISPQVIHLTKHIPCPLCNDGFTYPEKMMSNILHDLGINYKLHYYLKKDCTILFREKSYRPEYDFFFIYQNKKYLIEMDGGFHNKVHGKSDKTLEEIKYLDTQKDILAQNNGYILIRINCYKSDYDYIMNNITKSLLSKLFDFSIINKASINKRAYSSKIKDICDIYNNNSGLGTTDISILTGLSSATVRQYLKKGTEIGLCNYTKEEILNRSKLTTKVICLTTHEVFNSIKEAELCYGNRNGISSCCRGMRKYSGIHPKTEEPLRWMYYNKYLEMNQVAYQK